mgnify:CR=1 FL=1
MSTSPFLSGEDNPLPSVTGHPEWTYSILKEPKDLPTHIVSSKKLTKMVPKIDSKDETWYLGIKRLHRWFNIEGNCIALMAKLRDGLMINSGESLENDGKTVPVGENFFSTFSLSLPCARPRISCAILWSFYFACKQFHEERVWLTFSNYELIPPRQQVHVPLPGT